ncbi:MAG TPA: hypothetical protein VF131_05500 [Blastocatellia bacterium]|nr:hypothetical protein [Blastocatellia bacterium]
MIMKKRFCGLINSSIILFLALSSISLSTSILADEKDKKKPAGTPVMWVEPTDIATRDLLHGAGGKEMMPDLSQITFIREETAGYSTKYRVKDGRGRTWVAKVGKEAQPDTAANRLLWAVGYHTEIAHLVPSVTIPGKGTLTNVRFEARPDDVERTGDWKWDDNPFKNSPEFHGLLVMMVLINNWDIKDENNEILYVGGGEMGKGESRYIISDLGGSLGKTGSFVSRSRNKPEDFVKSEFIKEVKDGVVELNYKGKRQDLFKGITVEQARWLGERLARLSDLQIMDAFRAANYTPEEIEMMTASVKQRINALVALK